MLTAQVFAIKQLAFMSDWSHRTPKGIRLSFSVAAMCDDFFSGRIDDRSVLTQTATVHHA
jgi:hypothetical protein